MNKAFLYRLSKKLSPNRVRGEFLVEARGVEPLSENSFTKPSTSVCYLLNFPRKHPITGVFCLVAFSCVTDTKTTLGSRSPLSDALSEAVVLIGRTGRT